MRLPALLIAITLLGSCGGPKVDPVVVIMKNQSGADFNDFDLDTGSGHIQYQIFTKDFTFKEDIRPTTTAPLKLTHRGGSSTLAWTVKPEHAGGQLTVTFLPGGQASFDFEFIAATVPKETVEENTADAMKIFKMIDPGMTAEAALKITGHQPSDGRKYSSAKDFGWSLKPTCVQFAVWFYDAKVARVDITRKSGEVIVEKGIPKAEFDRLPAR